MPKAKTRRPQKPAKRRARSPGPSSRGQNSACAKKARSSRIKRALSPVDGAKPELAASGGTKPELAADSTQAPAKDIHLVLDGSPRWDRSFNSAGERPADMELRLSEVRKRLSLTQVELAALVHAHPITVCKWEKGKAQPDSWQLAVLRMLARASLWPSSFADMYDRRAQGGTPLVLAALIARGAGYHLIEGRKSLRGSSERVSAR